MRTKTFWSCGLLLALLAGCNSPPVPTYPVQGKITLDGQPLAGGTILFEPISPIDGATAYAARAPIQAGTYRLSMFGENDGAAAGDYRVAILVPRTGGSSEAGGDFVPISEKVAAYGDLAASNLTATVAPDPTANLSINFELASR